MLAEHPTRATLPAPMFVSQTSFAPSLTLFSVCGLIECYLAATVTVTVGDAEETAAATSVA